MTVLSSRRPLVRTSLADLVYNRLLEDILSAVRPSGTTLNIADIAKDFEVSPSPVREAILRLAAEGLVTNPTNRRATVISFAERDVIELCEVREFLECGATRLAAQHIDECGVAELRQAAEQCAALYGDPAQKKAMLELDNRFHRLVAEAGRNRTLVEELVRVSRRVRIMQWLRLDPATMSCGYPEHMAVVDGLQRHDAETAVAAMAAHIRRAGQLVLAGLRPSAP